MSVESLRDDASRAGAAYLSAVSDAEASGNWYMVAAAKHAAKQARSALKAAEELA